MDDDPKLSAKSLPNLTKTNSRASSGAQHVQSSDPSAETAAAAATSQQRLSCSLSDLQTYKDDLKSDFRHAPFSIRWVYGYNQKVTPINLTTNNATRVFYAASNCGIVYDWRTNDMKILQGHSNAVTCIAADGDGRWVAMGDSGPENTVTVWDTADFAPKRCIFKPHGDYKLSRLALSADAKYLLTLAYEDKPTLNWWIWSFGQDTPHASRTFDVARGAIIKINFDSVDTEKFFMLSKRELYIGQCANVNAEDFRNTEKKYELKVRKPVIKGCSEFGRLTNVAYAVRSRQLLASCTRGAVLVFGYTIQYTEGPDATNIDHLRFIKLLKLDTAPINTIATFDNVVVTGNDQGELRFYDLQLRLLYWCQGFKLKSIKGISCNVTERNCTLIDVSNFPEGCQSCPCTQHNIIQHRDHEEGVQQLVTTRVPTDATTQKKYFVIRDFIVCTEEEGIGMIDLIKRQYIPIVEHRSCCVSAVAIHSEKPLVCVGYEDGQLELIEYVTHKSIIKKDIREHFRVTQPAKPDSIHSTREDFIPNISASCLQYSPSGLHLACGLDNGDLIFLDPTTIDIKENIPLKATADAIQQICYSPDSCTLAIADDGRKVCVYTYDCDKREWTYLAKHRAHYGRITRVLFTDSKNEDGFYKLFSFGEDRIMVEYDIGDSVGEHLEILSLDRVEQTGVPLDVVEWPTPPEQHVRVPTVLVATDQHKYKIMNYGTSMTLKTLLGPRYDTPVNKLILAKSLGDVPDYMIIATKNLIGIQKLPLDGNPYKHVAMLGHPNEILDMCFNDKSRNLFTVGARDSCLHQWLVKYRVVDTTTKLVGGELYPYYCLLEGGRAGHLFQEMRDLFYYVQVLCQGTFSPALHRVGDFISIDSLPDYMRALGFFPTQYEVENILTEAKHDVYSEEPATEIGFEDVVRLYLNHRPAAGDDKPGVADAFRTFAGYEGDGSSEPCLSAAEFLDLLTRQGEQFSPELSLYLLKVLVGVNNEEDLTEEENFLPEDITLKYFVTEVLGLPEEGDHPESEWEVASVSKKSSGT